MQEQMDLGWRFFYPCLANVVVGCHDDRWGRMVFACSSVFRGSDRWSRGTGSLGACIQVKGAYMKLMETKTLSRRVGVVPPPPAPVQPQRAVLSPTELDRLQLVVYIPDANDPPPVDPSNCPTLPVDVTRLAYPPIYLSTHETTCVTCQETFIPPREGNAIMLKADPLGLLGCGHVFYLSVKTMFQCRVIVADEFRLNIVISGCWWVLVIVHFATDRFEIRGTRRRSGQG